jgi:hypothetical protein
MKREERRRSNSEGKSEGEKGEGSVVVTWLEKSQCESEYGVVRHDSKHVIQHE